MSTNPVIAVHGGAWSVPDHLWKDYIEGVKEAVKCGFKVLQSGGTALDAVERAVTSLEDNLAFNAGRGSCLTSEEQVEMDALIMDGRQLRSGSVAALKNVANPIRVARRVMEETPHALLVGEGANKFAAGQGIEEVDPALLVTNEARREFEHYKRFQTAVNCLFTNANQRHDTVGCVALDQERHVSCGTSTGGITGKMPGRVGDSPLVGCGGIADDEVGAISTTGHGEAITRVCLAKTVLNNISTGNSASSSIKAALNYMERRVDGFGGAVAVSRSGDVGIGFSTDRMAWAYVKDSKLHYGLHPNEHEVEDIRD